MLKNDDKTIKELINYVNKINIQYPFLVNFDIDIGYIKNINTTKEIELSCIKSFEFLDYFAGWNVFSIDEIKDDLYYYTVPFKVLINLCKGVSDNA